MEKKPEKKINQEKSEEILEQNKEIKENLQNKVENLKEDLSEKSEELKKELKDKTNELKEKTEKILKDVQDNSQKFDKKDIEENKAMACLSYIIAPVPYFVETKSKWVHYHAIQGMNLFIIIVLLRLSLSVLNSVVLFAFPFLKSLLKTFLYTFALIYTLIGIINVCNGEAKELPLINKFKFIKK